MSIKLKNIEKTENKIWYNFYVSQNIRKYFNFKSEFFIEYDINISSIPDSILVIPFLANILPIAWLVDEEIEIPEIDAEFYNSIEAFKKGYVNMYPMLRFMGGVKSKIIVNNSLKEDNNHTHPPLCFFSGGVDSFNTLIRHLDEKPILLSIWGSDITFDDFEGWDHITQIIDLTANKFNLKSHRIKSSFRYFLYEDQLSQMVKKSGDGWWHGFQHGIGIVSHAAPIAWLYKSRVCYFASSHSEKDLVALPCASHPSIDGNFYFTGTQIIHDGFEQYRQDKMDKIVKFKNSEHYEIKLHVCWQSSGGKNCNKCEKCLRTILGIIIAGGNPDDFELHYIPSNMKYLRSLLCNRNNSLQYLILLNIYWSMQQAFNMRYTVQKYPELGWFNKIKIEENIMDSRKFSKLKHIKKILQSCKCIIYKLLKDKL